MCRSLSAGLSERPDQGTGRTGIRRLSPHAESLPVPMSVGLLSPPGKSLPYPSFPDTRSCSQRPPGHLPFCGVQPVFLILCSSHTETIPKEETWSFQAVALYKNAMYATTFKKKKKCIKKDLFISEIDKLVVVTAENQTIPLTKEKWWLW